MTTQKDTTPGRPRPKTLEPCPVTTSRQGDPFYVWGDTVVPPSTADLYAAHKHLCDAELVAEYWRAGDDMAETNYDRDVNAEPIRNILERFATTARAHLTDWDLR